MNRTAAQEITSAAVRNPAKSFDRADKPKGKLRAFATRKASAVKAGPQTVGSMMAGY